MFHLYTIMKPPNKKSIFLQSYPLVQNQGPTVIEDSKAADTNIENNIQNTNNNAFEDDAKSTVATTPRSSLKASNSNTNVSDLMNNSFETFVSAVSSTLSTDNNGVELKEKQIQEKTRIIPASDDNEELWFIPRNYGYGLRYKIDYDEKTGEIRNKDNPLISQWFKVKDELPVNELDLDPIIKGHNANILNSEKKNDGGSSSSSTSPVSTVSVTDRGKVKATLPRDIFDLAEPSELGSTSMSYLGCHVLKEEKMTAEERQKHRMRDDRMYVKLGFFEGSGLRLSFPKNKKNVEIEDFKDFNGSTEKNESNSAEKNTKEFVRPPGGAYLNLEIDTDFKKVKETSKTQEFLKEEGRREIKRKQSHVYAKENTFYKPEGDGWVNLGASTHIWVDFPYVLGVKNLFAPYPHVYRYRDLLLQLDP